MGVTDTRRITGVMREIEHYVTGLSYRFCQLGNDAGNKPVPNDLPRWNTKLSRQGGDRSYWLEHGTATRAGIPIAVNVSNRSAWIRPARNGDGSQQSADMTLRRMAAETLLPDALFDVLEAAGFTIDPGSETRETLAEWRESRRYG